MYNRYIPQPDGSYRRNRLDEPCTQPPRRSPPQKHPEPPQKHPEPPHEPPCRSPQQISPPCQEQPPKHPPRKEEGPIGSFLKNLLPKDLDTGDLMVILLLLLMAGDCEEDRSNALLTLALYLFM